MSVVNGRDISTVSGACDKRVSAALPRSSCLLHSIFRPFLSSLKAAAEVSDHTRVSSEVLPEPLGPKSRKDGSVVLDGARNMRKWRNSGASNTTSMVVKIVHGDGCSNAVNKLSGAEGMASALSLNLHSPAE